VLTSLGLLAVSAGIGAIVARLSRDVAAPFVTVAPMVPARDVPEALAA
jgi:hypothetical protein